MVEDDETGGEDNDDDDGDAFGLEGAAQNRQRKKSTGGSEVWTAILIVRFLLTSCVD
jgi:hypothetical protein